jgi:serine/threonine-protein kinase
MADDIFGIVGTVQGGAFRVDQVVAEGGFAVVYRAYHAAFRSSVALKCLKVPRRLSDAEQKEFLEKFREEAELLFRLSAGIPSVVRPLHVGTLTQKDRLFVPFIALEWLDGRTLDHLVSERALAGQAPLDLRTAVKLLTPVADALCRAHRFPTPNGTVAIVHRDLKPENIFLATVNGREIAKVLDFGIAKVKNAATQIVGRESAQESPLSAFTPAYGAPEQWLPKRFGQTGAWTDVWGLAITLVEVLCGHAPIDGDHAAMMGSAIDPERRPTPRNEGAAVPDEVEALFARALAVDPRDRFHDVGEFWNPLCRAVGLPEVVGDHSPSLAPPPAAPAPSAPGADPRARTALDVGQAGQGARPGAPAGVPDLVVSTRPAARPPASGRGAAAPVSEAKPPQARAEGPRSGAAGSPSRGKPADPNALFGSSFESFDDDVPQPRLETDDGFGGGLVAAPSRGRPAAPPAFVRPASVRPGRGLDLSGAIGLLIVAVLLMAGDFLYATFTGEVLQLGPARMLWLAGPLAALGVVKLISGLLSAAD